MGKKVSDAQRAVKFFEEAPLEVVKEIFAICKAKLGERTKGLQPSPRRTRVPPAAPTGD